MEYWSTCGSRGECEDVRIGASYRGTMRQMCSVPNPRLRLRLRLCLRSGFTLHGDGWYTSQKNSDNNS